MKGDEAQLEEGKHTHESCHVWHKRDKLLTHPPDLIPEELLELRPILNRLLRFYTWTFLISLRMRTVGTGGVEYFLRAISKEHNILFNDSVSISLDSEWRNRQPEKLKFMALAQKTRAAHGVTVPYFFLILIEWKNSVAYRVYRAHEAVNSRLLLCFVDEDKKWS